MEVVYNRRLFIAILVIIYFDPAYQDVKALLDCLIALFMGCYNKPDSPGRDCKVMIS